MREDEAHRRAFGVAVKQQLFVLHNEVIGIDIVRCALLFVGELTVGQFSLFIN